MTGSTFSFSGVAGGGAINCIVQDPDNTDTYFIGGDVSALMNTTNGGQTWFPASAGVIGRTGVAAISYDPSNHANWYALMGKAGTGSFPTSTGGFYTSTDRGATWHLAATSPSGAGNGNFPGAGPRSVGRLIVKLAGSTHLYCGGFADGLLKSTTEGASGGWTTYGAIPSTPHPAYIRTIASDPGTPDTIYAGLLSTDIVNGQNGLYQVVSGGATTNHLTGIGTSYPSLVTCEELLFLGTRLYGVFNTSGVYFADSPYTTWTKVGSLSSTAQWCSIDGFHDSSTGKDTLVVGCFAPTFYKSGMYDSLMTTTDAGQGTSATWTGLTRTSANIYTNIYTGSWPPTSGTSWWIKTAAPNNVLGKVNHVTHSLVINSANHSQYLLVGKSGGWISNDTGTNWAPMTNQMGGTAHRSIVADSTASRSAHVALWSDDWNYFTSADHLSTIAQQNPNTMGTVGNVDIDETGKWYVAGGGGSHGNQVISSSDPTTPPTTWTDESVGAGFTSTPFGVLAGNDTHGRLLVVPQPPPPPPTSVVGALYVRSNGVWTNTSTINVAGGGTTSIFSTRPAGSGIGCNPVQPGRTGAVVWLFDASSGASVGGLAKSADYGQTWTKVYSTTVTGAVTHLEMDANGNLYVLVNNALSIVTSANSASLAAVVPVSIQNGANWAGKTCDAFGMDPNGNLYACTTPVDTTGGTFLYSTNQGATWTDLTPGTNYAKMSANIEAVAATNDGWVYMGANGTGAFVGSLVLPQGPGKRKFTGAFTATFKYTGGN